MGWCPTEKHDNNMRMSSTLYKCPLYACIIMYYYIFFLLFIIRINDIPTYLYTCTFKETRVNARARCTSNDNNNYNERKNNDVGTQRCNIPLSARIILFILIFFFFPQTVITRGIPH